MAEVFIMDQISTAELLGRIDERTNHTSQALIALDIKTDGLTERLGRVESTLDSFAPVKRVVYATIGIILMTILIAFLSLVVIQKFPQMKNEPQPQQQGDAR